MWLYILLGIFLAPQPDKPWWQDAGWIGVVVAALVGVIYIILWLFDRRKQNKRKEVAYQIISDTPIANINEEMKDRVEIKFDGNPITDMNLVVLKIWNRGGLAVRSGDYEESIRFELGGRTYITGEVLSREPEEIIKQEELKNFLKAEADGSVSLPRFLLNPQDSLSIKMLVTGKGKIRGIARIADGKIMDAEVGKKSNRGKTLLLLAVISTMIAFLLVSPLFIDYEILGIIVEFIIPISLTSIFFILFSLFPRRISSMRLPLNK
jgi:hypothetical protein